METLACPVGVPTIERVSRGMPRDEVDRSALGGLRTAVAWALPYDDDSFDAVTCVNGLKYGSEQALAEVARVHRPGRCFAMAFWSDARDYKPQLRGD